MATVQHVTIGVGDLTVIDATTGDPAHLAAMKGVQLMVLLRHRH